MNAAASGAGLGSLAQQLGGVLLALLLVLLLAWGVLKLLSRSVHGAGNGRGAAAALRVERVLSLGARERLVLVRYGEVQLLLGVTAGGIHLLDRSPPAHTPPAEGGGQARDVVL
jgi:flagellar protein FliO/FliZ